MKPKARPLYGGGCQEVSYAQVLAKHFVSALLHVAPGTIDGFLSHQDRQLLIEGVSLGSVSGVFT